MKKMISRNDYVTRKKIEHVSLHKLLAGNKFRSLLLLVLLLLSGVGNLVVRAAAKQDQSIQEGIAEEVLRFHVIANSDSSEDQALKLLIKDQLVAYLAPLVRDCENLSEVKEVVETQLPTLITLANNSISKQGFPYTASAALEDCYFPLKVYGSYTFPPGYYHALRVKLGKAEGRNWWCVMFPPLCFVDETYSIVDQKSGKKLSKLLTEEEYETLINKKTPIKVRLKLLEAIKELFKEKE